MDALLVFPYFLVKLFTHLGAETRTAEWVGALLSCICLVVAMMAPFHRRDVYKTSMAGVSWLIIVMAAIGCVWECKEVQRAAEKHAGREARSESFRTARNVVELGEA